MIEYIFRRLLLMIPTFLGSTVLVFTILQLAPGGPIEQIMVNLQMGGALGEGGGGLDSDGGLSLPPKALKELERFYGFDKPIYQRYLSWLGVWPREIKHRDFSIPKGIYLTSVNYDSGLKSSLGKKNTIIEALKTQDINSINNNKLILSNSYDKLIKYRQFY